MTRRKAEATRLENDMWISAADAASLLGVTRATLYAYVSRGYVRSQPLPGSSRARSYAREDLERLRRKTEERRDPDKATVRVLQWGMPILESSICLIDGQRLYYRGHDAVMLARTRSVQDVASLIWTGRFDASFEPDAVRAPTLPALATRHLPFAARAQALLALAGAGDPVAVDGRAVSVARCGWTILQLLTRTAIGRERAGETIDRSLARAWKVRARDVDVLRAALILCADHELNISSFTARCVASAGSHPYAAVIAGLTALEGTRHGGASARVESMLDTMRRSRDLPGAIADRLRRGERLDGFGHRLYPDGDPRATLLIELVRQRFSGSAELAFVLKFATAGEAAVREKPNLDFALVAAARVMRLPDGAPFMLFAIGRTIGWIGHAIEQYATGQLIRPRAKYVGIR